MAIPDAIAHLRSGRLDAALSSLMPIGYEKEINQDRASVVKEIASKFRHGPANFTNNEKLRVGYLTEGFDFTQAPVKRMVYLSEYHDKDALDIVFFSRIDAGDIPGSYGNYQNTISVLLRNGCKVVISPRYSSSLDRVLWLFDKIREERIDVLVTYAMATVPHLHLLCAMRPASILVKDCLQQPEMSDLPDVTIHHTYQTMKGDTGDCRLLPFRFPKPERVQTFKKSDLGLSENVKVVATVGRPGKFRQPLFKKAISELIEETPIHFLSIGNPEISGTRELNLGIQSNPFDILCDIADVYVDSFPLGGGWTIAEAMYAGLPVVMFESECNHNVSTTTLPEILGIPELTIKRWEITDWIKTISKLLSDTSFQDEMKERVKARTQIIGNYESYVRERESLYTEMVISKRCIRKFLSGNGALSITPPIYANNRPETIYIDNSADITIGKGLSISQEVCILRHEHFHDRATPIGKAGAVCSSLWIGEDVQIGARATILPGCKRIGNGAVIGAGSVVTKDIPDYEVWAGNPARKINERV